MQVVLYRLSKRKNSTKVPSATAEKLEISGALRDSANTLAPSISFSADPFSGNEPNYNYIYIPKFLRFYWIQSWTTEYGLWIANCKVDVLGSWRFNIGESTQYVLRSASQYDLGIMDKMYPTKGEALCEQITYDTATFFTSDMEQGFYVVGIISDEPQHVGAVTYYVMNNTLFNRFCEKLLSDTEWLNSASIQEIGSDLLKALVNPFQYVVSCMWFPCPIQTAYVSQLIKYGWWELTNIVSAVWGGALSHTAFELQGSTHPQQSRGTYLNLSPYTRRTLLIQPWGEIPLDTTIFSDGLVKIDVNIDPVSGIGKLTILDSQNTIYTERTAQIGVEIQLAQIARNYVDIATTALGAIGTQIAAVQFAGAHSVGFSTASPVTALATGISDVVNSCIPDLLTSGSNGSTVSYTSLPRLVSRFYEIADEDISNLGRPLCKPKKINTLSGYVLCSNADLAAPCSENELEEILNFMNTGFFYE